MATVIKLEYLVQKLALMIILEVAKLQDMPTPILNLEKVLDVNFSKKDKNNKTYIGIFQRIPNREQEDIQVTITRNLEGYWAGGYFVYNTLLGEEKNGIFEISMTMYVKITFTN